jgi:hypothetical protein
LIVLKKFGGDEGDRTPDLMNAIHALSQLSYVPFVFNLLAEFDGLKYRMNSEFQLKTE